MKAVLLAAGKGKRLKKQHPNTPKPLIKISGQTLIERNIDFVKKAGIKEIIIIVSPHNQQKIKRHLKSLPPSGLRIRFLKQKRQIGTADAIRLVKNVISRDFLLVYTDSITNFDVKKMIAWHKKKKAGITISVEKIRKRGKYGVVKIKNSRIEKISEKPKKIFSKYCACGFHIFSVDIFDAIDHIKPTADNEYHLADCVQCLIDKGKKVYAYEIDTWRVNINTKKDISLAEKLLK